MSEPNIVVTESIMGTWHYHISSKDNQTKSLCGKDTMTSNMKIQDWGSEPTHVPYSWCTHCDHILRSQLSKSQGRG